MKLYLTTVFLSVLSFSAISQNKHSINVYGGVNISSIYNADFISDDVDALIKPLVGAGYQLIIKDNFSIEMGLMSNQQGYVNSVDFTIPGDSSLKRAVYEFQFNYISIPAKLGWVFNLKNISLIPKLGVIPSFFTNGKSVIRETDVTFLKDETLEADNKFDFAALAELSLEASLNSEFSLFTAIGYRQSLTSYFDENESVKPKYLGFSTSLGVKYLLN